MKRSVVIFVSICFFAMFAFSTFGCGPDGGKMLQDKMSEAKIESLTNERDLLKSEVEALKSELKNCLEKRIKTLDTETSIPTE
jgi:hypothetical protein